MPGGRARAAPSREHDRGRATCGAGSHLGGVLLWARPAFCYAPSVCVHTLLSWQCGLGEACRTGDPCVRNAHMLLSPGGAKIFNMSDAYEIKVAKSPRRACSAIGVYNRERASHYTHMYSEKTAGCGHMACALRLSCNPALLLMSGRRIWCFLHLLASLLGRCWPLVVVWSRSRASTLVCAGSSWPWTCCMHCFACCLMSQRLDCVAQMQQPAGRLWPMALLCATLSGGSVRSLWVEQEVDHPSI